MRFVTFTLLISFVFLASCSKSNVKALTEQMGQEVIELAGNLKGFYDGDGSLEERLILRIPVVKNTRLELPPDIDEEPSGESEEDLKGSTSSSSASSQKVKSATPGSIAGSTTKKDSKKTTQNAVKAVMDIRKRGSKDIDKLDSISQGISAEEAEEEERIEKEFADLYKDNNADYKSDSTELKEKGVNGTRRTTSKDNLVTKTVAGRDGKTDKPVLRARTNPTRFQPDPVPVKASLRDGTQVRLHYDNMSFYSFKFQPDSYDSKDVERFRTSIDEISCGNRVTKLAEVVSSSPRALPGIAAVSCNMVILLTIIASISDNN